MQRHCLPPVQFTTDSLLKSKLGQMEDLSPLHRRFVGKDTHTGDVGRLPGIGEGLAAFYQGDAVTTQPLFARS